MDTRYLIAATLLWGYSLLADTPITREEAAALKSLDIADIEKQSLALEGKIIRLKFNYRQTIVEKTDDGSLTGRLTIFRTSTNARPYKYGTITVNVPAEGAEWFMKIPTVESRGSLLAIAKLVKGKSGPLTAEILGREIKTDVKGARIVW